MSSERYPKFFSAASLVLSYRKEDKRLQVYFLIDKLKPDNLFYPHATINPIEEGK